ncbi:Permease of the drug/metabolite transporter (DMT) superfamily [Rhizobiales bacterium GAS191]|nr:Permease of the drug/metabolite transporter (DMT) superfamily [Rhizobiales bacterium GAS113]SEE56911.1 Permease of the drug/metabolite transporter (DMT) superfamily [Rhizobiales bacterium GAS191]
MSPQTLGFLLGALGVLVFGGSLPMTRLAVAALDPWFVTMARPGIAGLLAAIVLIALRRRLPERATCIRLFGAGLCLVWGWPGLTNFAMRSLPAAHGGVVAGLLPLATSVAAALILRERPPLGFWLCAVGGAALVVGFALRAGGGHFEPADGLLLTAVVICAVGYVIAGDLSTRMPGWEVTSWMLVVMLPLSLPGTILLWPTHPAAIPLPSWAGFAYIALLSQYLGFFAWNAGLALGGVARVSQVQLLQTFVTLSFAWLINGEPLDPLAFAVAACVLVLILGARQSRASAPTSPSSDLFRGSRGEVDPKRSEGAGERKGPSERKGLGD